MHYNTDVQRNSNMELLRILATLGVFVLHYFNATVGGGFRFMPKGSVTQYTVFLLVALCIIAVNLFLLISGYFMYTANQNNTWKKPLSLLVQVSILGTLCYLCDSVYRGKEIDGNTLLHCVIPANYYVILYIAVYFISPYINVLLYTLSEKKRDHLVLTLFLLLSVEPFLVDCLEIVTGTKFNGLNFVGMYGDFRGYTLTHFLFMYLLGAWVRAQSQTRKQGCDCSVLRLLILFGFTLFCNFGIAVYGYRKYNFISGHVETSYCSPIIIVLSLVVFLIFLRFHFSSRLVNGIAKESLSVYLVMNTFIRHLNIQKIMEKGTAWMLLHLLFSGVIIYLLSWCVGYVYKKMIILLVYILRKGAGLFQVS